MDKLAVLATLIILLQSLLSLHQIKYYNQFLFRLAKKYEQTEGYTLSTEIEKNILRSAVVAVVVDQENRIQEYYSYSGLTIFSTFKPSEVFHGRLLDQELLNEISNKRSSLKMKALKKIICKEQLSLT